MPAFCKQHCPQNAAASCGRGGRGTCEVQLLYSWVPAIPAGCPGVPRGWGELAESGRSYHEGRGREVHCALDRGSEVAHASFRAPSCPVICSSRIESAAGFETCPRHALCRVLGERLRCSSAVLVAQRRAHVPAPHAHAAHTRPRVMPGAGARKTGRLCVR